MNLFITSDDLEKSAQFLDDRRLIKSILENTQLLSTSINLVGGKGCYKTTHSNHIISRWTRKTRGNFEYVLEFTRKLTWEYKLRFNKVHACYFLLSGLEKQKHLLPAGERTELCNCAKNERLGLDFSKESNTKMAYKFYLHKKWQLDGEKAFSHLAKRSK